MGEVWGAVMGGVGWRSKEMCEERSKYCMYCDVGEVVL